MSSFPSASENSTGSTLKGEQVPSPSLATIPYELLEEIASYLLPKDLYAPPIRADQRTLDKLSRTCKRLKYVFQPHVFEKLVVRNDKKALALYAVLNGDNGYTPRPLSPDADPLARKLSALRHVWPIPDVVPASEDKAYLRHAVKVLIVHSPGLIDLRFLLQMMPRLKHLHIWHKGDHPLLDQHARVLRKWHNLEYFFYARGPDLTRMNGRLPFPRAVANMSRLRHVELREIKIGTNPWIFTEDVGVGVDPTREDQKTLGDVWKYVWYRPQLLFKEPPSSPWLPTTLDFLHLSRIEFLAPEVPMSAAVAEILKKRRARKDSLEEGAIRPAEVPEGENAGWPVDFHPFSRLVLCSHRTLRTLFFTNVNVPHDVVMYALRIVGPRLTTLRVRGYSGSVVEVIACCPRLQILGIDGHDMSEQEAIDMLNNDLHPHFYKLDHLNLFSPWNFERFAQWIGDDSSSVNMGLLPSLRTITLVCHHEPVEAAVSRTILEAARNRNNMKKEDEAVTVLLGPGFLEEEEENF
ncbi:hypothetical protein PUNSTDRAFT_146535 [Punctularia strigosozonata HHB-11173 SS5]|uniref:F-box domain-containing protein n=1 Tax=Punctularia strigosozonata (strain HHB-11173) TaxID=741275 RepID=R7S273_PUNST|nr:uncharacterized protein PUNSTDRAFT_146535 [Punctularia strigosozonata HHB-11173 SS5]EIN04293.1 hypothetical protein PUNSTDRAFT_146535 [Punctularia strigosozonata HHB-11173 SS5]